LMVQEDSKLLEEFLKGDEQAFESLVCKYKTVVYGTIHSIVGNIQDAEDVSQEVFLNIYKTLNSFRGQSSLSSWIYRIAVNKSIDNVRKKKNKAISLETELDNDEKLKLLDVLSSKEDSDLVVLEKTEFQKTVSKVMNSLPEKFRVILTLKELEGLSYDEISKIMNISVNKVKVWLFRARKKLKKDLALSD